MGFATKNIWAAAIVTSVLAAGQAKAVLIDFEPTSGYTPGLVAGQPTAGSPQWSDTNNAFSVVAGAGKNGTAGLRPTSTTASSSSPQSASYSLASVGTFTGTQTIGYSFDVLGTGNNGAVRLTFGNSAANYAAYFALSLNATGVLRIDANGTTTLANTPAGSYHTISGQIDYANKVYSVSVDGGTPLTGLAFGGTTAQSSFGSIIVQDRYSPSTTNTAQLTFDNFNVTVPEPGSLALLGLGGLLLRRKR